MNVRCPWKKPIFMGSAIVPFAVSCMSIHSWNMPMKLVFFDTFRGHVDVVDMCIVVSTSLRVIETCLPEAML